MRDKQGVIIDKCTCGFPLPPAPRTFKESLICFKQIQQIHNFKCPDCGKDNIIVG